MRLNIKMSKRKTNKKKNKNKEKLQKVNKEITIIMNNISQKILTQKRPRN